MATSAIAQGKPIAPLMAFPTRRTLPNLGSGMNLFDQSAQAAGNLKLRLEVQGSYISIKA